MNHTIDNQTFVSQCLASGASFYLCHMPGAHDIMRGASMKPLRGLHSGGFVISPFDGNPEGIFTIVADLDEHQLAGSASFENSATHTPDKHLYRMPEASTTRQQHAEGVRGIVSRLNARGGGKTVLSRVILTTATVHPATMFDRLRTQYPEAMTVLFHTPGSGTWIAATPELLLNRDHDTIHTMSLAGTRKAGSLDKWDTKNSEEQQIVTDYINSVLCDNGFTTDISDRFTLEAGPVEHLCNRIMATKPKLTTSETASLLSKLSPTPALGGYPKDKALADIADFENFQRGYYGGFCGPSDAEGNLHLNVILRCMRLEKGIAAIYAGGGITRSSNADIEWKETEMKASTLLRALV